MASSVTPVTLEADPPTAVFDLDGTLLDGDSTGRWLGARIGRSPLRLALALLVAPVALPMIFVPSLRRRGASMLLWIATFGLNEAALVASFTAFAARFAAGSAPLAWRPGGLTALDGHRARGDRVVVVTAAPQGLAQALVASRYPGIDVLGSSLKPRLGGWVADRHCRNREKCAVLAEAGYGQGWAFAYTDSADDLPILERAGQPRLVNPRPATARRVGKGTPALETLWW